MTANYNTELDGTRTAEEAMSLLYTTDGRTETRLCMEAGF